MHTAGSVSSRLTLLKGSGSSWTSFSSLETRVPAGVFAAASNDVWIAGANGMLDHFGGTGLAVVQTPDLAAQYTAIHGTGPRDVFAVSAANLYAWDGSSWSRVVTLSNVTQLLTGVWADVHHVWIGGRTAGARYDDVLLLQR